MYTHVRIPLLSFSSLLREGFELESVCRAWVNTLHEKKKITSQETSIRMQQVDILRAAEGMYRVKDYKTTILVLVLYRARACKCDICRTRVCASCRKGVQECARV